MYWASINVKRETAGLVNYCQAAMRRIFDPRFAGLAFMFWTVFLIWGLFTAFAIKRIPSLPDDEVYIDPPSLLETLGIGIEVRWPRLGAAAASGMVVWVLYSLIQKQNNEVA